MILAIVAIAVNAIVMGITVIRMLLLPLVALSSICIAIIGCVGGYFVLMLLGLPLAMITLVMPLIPLGIVLIVSVLVFLWLALELIPVCLVAAGLALSVIALAVGKKHRVVRILAPVLGIVGIGVTALSAFLWGVCKLIACTPLILPVLLCLVFLVQMVVIAIGNAAV